MCGAKGLFAYCNSAQVCFLSLSVPSSILVQASKVIEVGSKTRILRPSGHFIDRYGTLVKRFCFRVPVPVVIESS